MLTYRINSGFDRKGFRTADREIKRQIPTTTKYIKWEGIFVAYFITDRCNRIGACLPVCLVEAISEGDPVYVIDPEKCIECGACAAACPTGAIDPPK